MRVLVAPDKFKDALDANAVSEAIAAGLRAANPSAEIVMCPLADGGEGTGVILARHLNAEMRSECVLDPLGRIRAASWWQTPDGRTAIVEMAEASGLALLRRHERDALRATSYGTGQLIAAARAAGCDEVLLTVGGSATMDGGAGCLQALGWQLIDADGHALPKPADATALERTADLRPPEGGVPTMRILCDVDNPLVGARGAANVFAPQKGADAAAVARLARAHARWANLLERIAGREIRNVPHGGAVGGLPAALMALSAARACYGFDVVADIVALEARLRCADLCITGEGRLDDQTAGGKTVAGVARLAQRYGVSTVVLCGAVRLQEHQTLTELAQALGVARIQELGRADEPLAQSLRETRTRLQDAAEHILRGWAT